MAGGDAVGRPDRTVHGRGAILAVVPAPVMGRIFQAAADRLADRGRDLLAGGPGRGRAPARGPDPCGRGAGPVRAGAADRGWAAGGDRGAVLSDHARGHAGIGADDHRHADAAVPCAGAAGAAFAGAAGVDMGCRGAGAGGRGRHPVETRDALRGGGDGAGRRRGPGLAHLLARPADRRRGGAGRGVAASMVAGRKPFRHRPAHGRKRVGQGRGHQPRRRDHLSGRTVRGHGAAAVSGLLAGPAAPRP